MYKESDKNYYLSFLCVVLFIFALFAPVRVVPAFSSEKPFNILDFEGPRMKDLYYVITRDMDAQLLAMSTGQIDVLSDIFRPADVRRLAQSEMVNVSLASTFHAFFITFNVRRFPWDQLELRLAASQVVNRRQWTRDLFAGFCEPLATFLPHVSPYHEPNVEILPYGIEAARQRLADAGWTWNRSGWLVAPDGREVPPTRIFCPPSTVAATSTEIAHLMAEALRAIGMPVEAEPMDFQTMLARVNVRDFDACTNAWNMGRNPDSLYAFYPSAMDVEGGFNLSGIADPELDAVLYALRYAPDRATARVLASE
ncbi:MAG: ABC transporter substrate-binding protein, partial [Defluviitaleaceae bacterium]|nr:ABC transporter substrate-binding protein [Defluviitaleaceae bacterium]